LDFQGKGFYIWQIPRCEGGDVNAIAYLAAQGNYTHVLVKIADGTSAYNLDSISGADLVPPLVAALRARNIHTVGWHYVYGYEPLGEADIAIQRIQQTGVEAYVIDAEDQYKLPGRDVAAAQFMGRLRAALPSFTVALSSYRYPSVHPQLPWRAFLEKCDYNMPQVYWVGAHNPGDQLTRSLREFQALEVVRPYIPTGSAYLQGSWQPTVADINEFLQTARNLNLSAANFWEWGHTRLYLPELWDAIQAFPWPVGPIPQDIVDRYIAALNSHDIYKMSALYSDNGVHVTGDNTDVGKSAIEVWYWRLFNQLLPQATFRLVETSGSLSERHFKWTATSSAGQVLDGNDSFGLVADKIVYHYTYFTITR
jgi:hypothetical protein